MIHVIVDNLVLTYDGKYIHMGDIRIDHATVWSDPLYLGHILPTCSQLILYIIRFIPLMDPSIYMIATYQDRIVNILNGISTIDSDFGILFNFNNQLDKIMF